MANWFKQVLAGERKAFDELDHEISAPKQSSVSYRLLGNSQDAKEVTSQDAFLESDSRASIRIQKPEAFGGWLMRIVSNLYRCNYRRRLKD